MKAIVFIFICFMGSTTVFSQPDFILTHDYENYHQFLNDGRCTEDYCFSLGSTVCSTGSCGMLSKYDNAGEIVFSNVIRGIDINSRNCMEIIEDKIHIVGLSVDEFGVKHMIYDMDGELMDTYVINRDTTLDYLWPIDVLYEEDYFLVAVLENYENESRREAIWKVDYEGNVLQYLRLPDYFRSEIYTLKKLQNGNLFVTQPYIDDSLCVFHPDLDGEVNAVIFRELDMESLEEIRSRKEICYESTSRVGYDVTQLDNGDLIRTVRWGDEDMSVKSMANIVYDSLWNTTSIHKYESLIVSWPYSFGYLWNSVFYDKGKDYYYVVGGNRYDLEDEEEYYIDLVIEKWDIDHELIWRKTISSPITHKRMVVHKLIEQESKLKLFGEVYLDLEDSRTFDLMHLSMSLDGCFNDDCNDTIYVGELLPVSTLEQEERDDLSIFPNPTTDRLWVRWQEHVLRYEILTSGGQSLRLENVDHRAPLDIDVSSLAAGMYYLRLWTATGVRLTRFVKG